MDPLYRLSQPHELRQVIDGWRRAGLSVGLVPTMGFLHRGHLSLIEQAREHADRVVVSLFVNPTQFGPDEDLEEYPSDIEGDAKKVEDAGAHLLFLPEVQTMYPPGAQTFVEVEGLTDVLCGAARPVHFRGVTTIVSMLFHLVRPDVAVFGEKDYQQITVIRQMVRDLHFGIEILGGITVREKDGLALSSRNAYLDPEERQAATCLSRAIAYARRQFAQGVRAADAIRQGALDLIEQTPKANVQYLELRDALTLREAGPHLVETDRIFLAVHVGDTRLIDNAPLGGEYNL